MRTSTPIVSLLVLLCAAPTARAQGERFHLLADDGAPGDFFGWACAAGGGLALVGARLADDSGVNSGVVYVFDAATGLQLRKLQAQDASAGKELGGALAVDGGIALVGARNDDERGSQAGAAYLFDLATGQQLRKLLATDGAAGDHFGGAVALSGGLALVGAADDDDFGQQSGAAYVFEVSSGQQLFKLLPEDGTALDLFGASVALDGTTAVVGAYLDDDLAEASGAAYLFDASTGQELRKLLPNDGAFLDRFGHSVAISGTRVLVGSLGNANPGAAYLFDAPSGVQTAKLQPSSGGSGSAFGHAVALEGQVALVGAYLSSLLGDEAGAAYRFNAASGAQVALMLPEQPAPGAWLGRSVAVGDGIAVIGAPLDEDSGFAAGSAYLFQVGFGSSFCDAADAALDACPCSNPGSPETGCDNAQGTGGVTIDVLEQIASVPVATLAGSGFPPATSPAALVLRSGALEAAPVVFGDGLRCVAALSLVRLAATTASGGVSRHAIGHGAGPGGFHYQLWYRNAPAPFCDPAAAFNLSSGVTLTW